MTKSNIGFVGAGNMAQAIIGGLIKTGTSVDQLYIYEPNEALARQLAANPGIQVMSASVELLEYCDVIVLAVKPQIMQQALAGFRGAAPKSEAFFISVAAGLPIALMQKWLRAAHPIVRVMPNTPALVGAGVSGLFASDEVNEAQRQQAESILRAVGSVIWVDEEALIDSVTAVSGSGPAYFFYFIEALEKAALQNGLNAEQAKILSLETAFGAAKLALESDVGAATLRERVTSPGGTTEAALKTFADLKFSEGIAEAVAAAATRARKLAKLADS